MDRPGRLIKGPLSEGPHLVKGPLLVKGRLSEGPRLVKGPLSGEEGNSSTLLLRLDPGERLETFAVSLPVGELDSGSSVRISSHSVLSRPSTWPLSGALETS